VKTAPTRDNGTGQAPRRELKRSAAPPLTADEIHAMVAETAYYLSEKRGFEPGHDVDDWLVAEAQVLDRIAGAIR
jgi:hypothetical protein